MSSGPGHLAAIPGGRLVPGFEVPAGLARNVADDEEHYPARRAWLEALPRTVADLADRWSLRVGQAVPAGRERLLGGPGAGCGRAAPGAEGGLAA